jgi:hypothetical protein
MRECVGFYICPVCFVTSDEPGEHHDRRMVHCEELPVGDDRLKPIINSDGDLKSHAPRWFLEAVWRAAGMEYPATSP